MRFVSSICSDLIWDFWIKWKIPKNATFVVSKITCFRPEENLINISYPISFKVHFYIYELDAFNLTTTISIFLVRKKTPINFWRIIWWSVFFSVSVTYYKRNIFSLESYFGSESYLQQLCLQFHCIKDSLFFIWIVGITNWVPAEISKFL